MRTAEPTRRADPPIPITDDQRRALFAWAEANGRDINDIRAMTPKGSISMLTKAEAYTLLNRLNGHAEDAPPPRRKRRPQGVYALASPAQHKQLETLIDRLVAHYGWTRARFDEWLATRHHADRRPMTRIDSSADAAAVAELLKGFLIRAKKTADNMRELAEEAPPIPDDVQQQMRSDRHAAELAQEAAT